MVDYFNFCHPFDNFTFGKLKIKVPQFVLLCNEWFKTNVFG